MNYKNIHNPLEVDVQTGFKGEYFVIPSKGTKSFPEDLVARFIEVYPFLEIKGAEREGVEVKVAKEVKVEKKVTKKAKK